MKPTFRQSLYRRLIPWLVFAALATVAPSLIFPKLNAAEAAWMSLVGILATTSIFLISLMRLVRRLNRELEGITLTARENARGDLERHIDTDSLSTVELRELAVAINAMSARAREDISEMKRLARVRSEFLGNVSHELRTPIFSVQGYLETLIDGAVDDPTVRHDFLEKAHHNVLRLHTLLTDLIEISRIESGEMRMSFRYFDPEVYFRAVTDELRPTAEMAGIDLSFARVGTRTGETTALGDRERLKQVVTNLVENAIKYNRPGGTVTVEVEPGAALTLIRVRDTGIGIPAADLDRIFERFYRVNKDRSRSVGGSGLGLAIAKHIIEAHGSHIVVTSEAGVGSVFEFSLKR